MSATLRGGRRWGPALALGLVVASALGCGDFRRWAYGGGFEDRDAWQQPERVIDALAIQRGQQVADVGAGGGYFTFRLADAVGPEGRVYAADIDSEMLEHLRAEGAQRGYANVETVLARADDPALAEGSLDLLVMVNTYHHLKDQTAYFRNARRYLRPGARVAVIDYRDERWFTFGHASDAPTVRAHLEAAGYAFVEQHEFLERQYFLVFAAP